MKTLLLCLIGAAMIGGLTACNTVAGAGRDVSAVGQDISAGARAVQREGR
jgi:entericidin A